jgi:hypothetical protein
MLGARRGTSARRRLNAEHAEFAERFLRVEAFATDLTGRGAVTLPEAQARAVRSGPIDLRSGAIESVSCSRRGLSHNGVFRQPGEKAFIPPIVIVPGGAAHDGWEADA